MKGDYQLILLNFICYQFKLWKEHHGKMYGTDEEHETRAKIWNENVKFIHEHNKQAKSYTVEMNHFGDMVRINSNFILVSI